MTEVEQSRRSTERSSAHQKSLAPLLLHEGNMFSNLDLKETMLVAYEQAIQLAPHEAILHLHRGHALEQMGRIVEAQRAYAEAHRLGYEFASSFEGERHS